jgi:hypothetical protein
LVPLSFLFCFCFVFFKVDEMRQWFSLLILKNLSVSFHIFFCLFSICCLHVYR